MNNRDINNSDVNIVLWVIRFDDDPYGYVHTNIDRAIDSVRSFTEIYTSSEDPEMTADVISASARDMADQLIGDYEISAVIRDHRIHIRRVTLDNQNVITRIIMSAYDKVDDKTREMIDSILSF